MIASSSKSLPTAYAGSTLLQPSPALRRLLLRLDKDSLISLVLHWLHCLVTRIDDGIAMPALSRRPIGDSKKRDTSAASDLALSRRSRTLEDLQLLWNVPMQDSRITKSRVVDRIMEVDWTSGISYDMVAQVDSPFLGVRTWTAAKLVGAGEVVIPSLLDPAALRRQFSKEVQYYFSHHLFVSQQRSKNATNVDSVFMHCRLSPAPSNADLCSNSQPLHVLLIPASPFVLISGSGTGNGKEVRNMTFSALAQTFGAEGVVVSGVSSSTDFGDIDLSNHQEKYIPELRGQDPFALRTVLLSGSVGGGKVRSLLKGEAEDSPFTDASKRRRDEAASWGWRINAKASDVVIADSAFVDSLDIAPHSHPAHSERLAQATHQSKLQRGREAKEHFGSTVSQKEAVEQIERIDFQLNLPFPDLPPYASHSISSDDTIRMRLEGTHVLAGLRKLVTHQDTTGGGKADRLMLPTWLSHVRGTKVEVTVQEDNL